jgi:hypothetical protein
MKWKEIDFRIVGPQIDSLLIAVANTLENCANQSLVRNRRPRSPTPDIGPKANPWGRICCSDIDRCSIYRYAADERTDSDSGYAR